MGKARIVIGLLLVACAALSSTGSAAGASYFPTTKQAGKTTFEAKQQNTHVFTTDGRHIECFKAVFKGVDPPKGGSKKIKVFPTYEECKFAGEPASATNEGCEFEFNEPTGTHPKYSGTSTIITNKASECHLILLIKVTSFPCEIVLQSGTANSNLSTVRAEDLTGNLGLVITSELSGLTYTATGTGCGLVEITSGKEGKYTGEVETESLYVK